MKISYFVVYTPYDSNQVFVFLLVLEDQEELDDEIWRGLQHCHSVQNMSWKSSTKPTLSCLNSFSSSIFDYLKWYSTYPSSNVFLKHLEAFLEVAFKRKVCAGARERTKYGLSSVENCQEHVQFWIWKTTFNCRICQIVHFYYVIENIWDDYTHRITWKIYLTS